MKTFFEEAKALIGIALACWLLAVLIFLYAAPSPARLTDEVDRIVKEMDSVYSGQSGMSKHGAIIRMITVADWREFKHTALMELALGLFIAGVVIVTVEVHTRRHMKTAAAKERAELAKDVLGAVYGRLIPASISKELEGILKMSVCKASVKYVLTLTRSGFKDLPADRLVVRRVVYYRLRNLTGKDYTHTVRSVLITPAGDSKVTDADGREIIMPRQTAFRVNNEDVHFKDRAKIEHAVMMGPAADLQHEIYLAGEEVLPVTHLIEADIDFLSTLRPMPFIAGPLNDPNSHASLWMREARDAGLL
jgi:hypothetical protein